MWPTYVKGMDANHGAVMLSAAVLSVVHGIVPNHWLPFALVARVQGWNTRRTLWVIFAVMSVHLGVTGVLAGLLMGLGTAFLNTVRNFSDILPGAVMLAAGSVLLALDILGARWPHRHMHDEVKSGFSDTTAVTSLVVMFALSPCEALAAVFVSAIPFYSPGFLALIVLLAGLVTIVVTSGLVLATLKGVIAVGSRFPFKRERALIGAVLMVLGALTLGMGLLG